MATSIIKLKLLHNTDKIMSKLLLFQVVFLSIHLGCTEEGSRLPSNVFNSHKAFPEGNNCTENSSVYAVNVRLRGLQEVEALNSVNVKRLDASELGHFIPALSEDCQHMLQEYAIISSGFMYCALAFSKPLLFCETCVDKFTEADRKFKDIEKRSLCDGPLLRSDRVQILRVTHEFMRQLWDKGSCKNCFKDMASCEKKKQSPGCNVTDDVVQFQKYLNETLICFDKASASNLDVCVNCSAVYHNISKFFRSMGDVEDICIDCVEQMNSTRKEWSIIFNCTRTERDTVSIVAISVFLCSLPIFFYTGSKLHTTKTELKLMKLNRLNTPHGHPSHRLPTLPEHGDNFLSNESRN